MRCRGKQRRRMGVVVGKREAGNSGQLAKGGFWVVRLARSKGSPLPMSRSLFPLLASGKRTYGSDRVTLWVMEVIHRAAQLVAKTAQRPSQGGARGMEIRIGLGLGGEQEKKRPGPECRNWPPFETPSPVDMDFWKLHGLVSWLAIVARRSVDMAWVWRTLGEEYRYSGGANY